MYKSKTIVRVRYGETDQMGYVYHGNYPAYIEIGRLEWLRDLGISYKDMEAEGIMLPVYALSIRYIQPAYYDDVLEITTSIKKLPSVRIEFQYEIRNQKKELITTAETTLVFLKKETRKPTRCPAYFLDKLQ